MFKILLKETYFLGLYKKTGTKKQGIATILCLLTFYFMTCRFYLVTIGTVLLERSVILERFPFDAHLKGLKSTYEPDFFTKKFRQFLAGKKQKFEKCKFKEGKEDSERNIQFSIDEFCR